MNPREIRRKISIYKKAIQAAFDDGRPKQLEQLKRDLKQFESDNTKTT